MNTASFRQWFSDRLASVQLLVHNRGDVAIPDAEIILCCAHSALAAQRWPGKGIDRARFVQLLVDFANPSFAVNSVSTPILAARLRLTGNTDDALRLQAAFFPGPDLAVLLGPNVDRPEHDVLELLPRLERKFVRAQSYAALIYTGLRSQLVHEYSLSALLSSFSHSEELTVPTYTNMSLDPTPRQMADLIEELRASETLIRSWSATPIRKLHFPLSYIREVIASAAAQGFESWDQSSDWEIPRPRPWWIDDP